MSQFDMPTIDPTVNTGTQLATWLNGWQDAIETSHAGPARPAYVKPGMLWVQQLSGTDWKLFVFDGTHDIQLSEFNPTTGGVVAQFLSVTGGTLTGDLNFSGAARRITGDMSNATLASRLAFQSNIANAATALALIPNGTAQIADLNLANRSDPNNASYLQLEINNTTASISSISVGTGIILPMAFVVGGAERMRIGITGGIGIGIAPAAWSVPALDVGSWGAMGPVGAMYLLNNQYYDGNFKAKTAGISGQFLHGSSGFSWGTAPNVAAGAIATTPIQMILDPGGNLLIGTTSLFNFASTITPGINLGAGGQFIASFSNAPSLALQRTGSDGQVAVFNRQLAQVGNISVTAAATTYNTTSDYRLKNIAGPLINSGAFIDALEPVVGTWKSDGSPFSGFIAHDYQKISPGSVTGKKDEIDEECNPIYQCMDPATPEVMANIVAELKSLRVRVASIESKTIH